MNMTIEPCSLRGRVTVPASKSMAHRALIAAALADGPTELRINALNDDISATIDILTGLSADISADSSQERVHVKPAQRKWNPDIQISLSCFENCL